VIEQSEQQEPFDFGPIIPSSGFHPQQQGTEWAPADFYRRRGAQLDPGTRREVGWGELFLRNLDENFSIPRAFGSLRRGIFGEEFQEDYEPLADPNIGLVPPEFRSMLSDAPNPNALRRRALQLSRELENAKAFELAGGTALFTAGMSAVVLDPLTWIDVIATKGRITIARATQLTKMATRLGNARRAQEAAKLGRKAAFREGFMVGGATGAVTEWDLMSSFELRTEIDSMTQLLGSTILGAGLGSAFYRLETKTARQAGRDLLAADNYAAQEAELMPKLEKIVRERGLDPDTDQEEIARIWTDELLAGKAQDDVLRLARWKMPSESANAITRNFRRVRNFGIGLLGPAMRATLSEVDAARAYAHNFSSLPVERRFAPDSVMGRVALEVEKTRIQNDIRVITYAYERTVKQLAGANGREVDDYHRIVSETLRRGDRVNAEILQKFTPSKGGDLKAEEIEEINRIVKEVRSGFEQIEEIASATGAFQNLIPADNTLAGTAISYFTRMYKIDAIEADEEAFEALINSYFRKVTKENPVKLEVVMDHIKGTSGASHHAKLSSTDQTLARKLLIPDDYEITYQGRVVRFSDFLENNPTTVLESFTNHVVPELLHARRFMSSDVAGMTRSIGDQLNKLELLVLQLKNDPNAPDSLSLKENILAGLYEARMRAAQLRRLSALETNDAASEKIDKFLELWEREYEAGSELARWYHTGDARRREKATGLPGGLVANDKVRGRDEPPERTDSLFKTPPPEAPDPTNELDIASRLGEVEHLIDQTEADLDFMGGILDHEIRGIENDLNEEMSERLESIVEERYGKEETWKEKPVGPGTTLRRSAEEKRKAAKDREALEAAEGARAKQEAALKAELKDSREALRNSSNNAKRTKEKAEARLAEAKAAIDSEAPELSPEERSKAEAKVKELKKEVSAARKEYKARKKELDDFDSEPNPSKRLVFVLSREDRKKLRDLIRKRDIAKKKLDAAEEKWPFAQSIEVKEDAIGPNAQFKKEQSSLQRARAWRDYEAASLEVDLMGGEGMLDKRSTPKNAFTEEPLAEAPAELTQATLFSEEPYRGSWDPDNRQGFSVTTAQAGYGYDIRLITHDPETGKSIPHMWVVIPHSRVSRSKGFQRIAYDETTTTPCFATRDEADAAARRTLGERIRDKERKDVPDDGEAEYIKEALEEAKAERRAFADKEQERLRSLKKSAKRLKKRLEEARQNREESEAAYETAKMDRNVEKLEKRAIQVTRQPLSVDRAWDNWNGIGKDIEKFDKDYKSITGEDPPERIAPLSGPVADESDVDAIVSYFNESVAGISASRRDAYTRAIEVDRFKKAIYRWYKKKRRGETNPKVIKRLRVSRDKAIADIEQMHRAFMGMPDPQSDPTSVVSRTTNVFKTSSILSKMGGVTISSLPDLTLGILVHGLGPYLQQVRYQLANMHEVMPRFGNSSPKFRDEMSDRLFAMEVVAEQTRMERMNGFEEQIDSSATPFERLLQKGRAKFGSLSGARWWNSRARIFNTMMAQRRLIRDVHDYAAGTLSERRLRDLQVNRVTKSDLVRWKKELDANAKTQDMDGLSNPWEWANAGAWEQGNRIRWEQALLQYSKQTLIDVEDGDLHRFMRSPIGSTIFQFKSFFTASTQRLLVRDLQRPDIIRYARYTFLATAGAVTHVLKEWIAGRDPFEEEPQQFVLNAIDRSGMLGWAMEINNMLEVATSGKLGMSAALGVSTMKRYSTRNLVDALFGPSLGTSYALGEILKEPFTDSPLTDTDVARVRRLVPFNNLFYLRWLFDFGEEAANSAFDVERRSREGFSSGVRR